MSCKYKTHIRLNNLTDNELKRVTAYLDKHNYDFIGIGYNDVYSDNIDNNYIEIPLYWNLRNNIKQILTDLNIFKPCYEYIYIKEYGCPLKEIRVIYNPIQITKGVRCF